MTLHVSNTVMLIIRKSKLYYIAAGIITSCRLLSGVQVEKGLVGMPLSTCAPDGHLQRVTIPDAVQYNLTS